jgi:hypothetical protein
MDDGIGSQLVQLNPVNKKESPEKLMNMHGEAAKEEINENYPISLGWIGSYFVYGNLHLSLISESIPSFFSFRCSIGLNIDLSHLDTFFFSIGSAPAVPLLMRFDLTMVADEWLGHEVEARRRVRWQWCSGGSMRRSEKGKK